MVWLQVAASPIWAKRSVGFMPKVDESEMVREIPSSGNAGCKIDRIVQFVAAHMSD